MYPTVELEQRPEYEFRRSWEALASRLLLATARRSRSGPRLLEWPLEASAAIRWIDLYDLDLCERLGARFPVALNPICDRRNMPEAPPLFALKRMRAAKPALVTYLQVVPSIHAFLEFEKSIRDVLPLAAPGLPTNTQLDSTLRDLGIAIYIQHDSAGLLENDE